MSAGSSLPPTNILMLGVLGVGAYWMLTRRAHAAQAAPSPAAAQGARTGSVLDTAGRVAGLLGNLFGGSGSSTGTYDGRAAMPWDTTPAGGSGPAMNNPSAYVSGGLDGIAANPVNSSPYDTFSDPAQYGLA